MTLYMQRLLLTMQTHFKAVRAPLGPKRTISIWLGAGRYIKDLNFLALQVQQSIQIEACNLWREDHGRSCPLKEIKIESSYLEIVAPTKAWIKEICGFVRVSKCFKCQSARITTGSEIWIEHGITWLNRYLLIDLIEFLCTLQPLTCDFQPHEGFA